MKSLFLLLTLLVLILGIVGGAGIYYLSQTSDFSRSLESTPPRATPVPGSH